MKRLVIVITILAITLVVTGMRFSPQAKIGPIPNPPDGDWPTWVSVLESRMCFDGYIHSRLVASGFDWSYDHFSRRVSIRIQPTEKMLSIRVYLVSEKEAAVIAEIISASLNDYIQTGLK
jgi:hypothetical protein